MPNKPKYIKLPIYSIVTHNQYYFLSGGGGGKTGIKNQLLIYRHKIQNAQPVFRLQTDDKIVENMYIVPQKNILIASASSNIKVYDIVGKQNQIQVIEKFSFQADYAPKNSTIYSLCYQAKRNLLCTAGQDLYVRFYSLNLQNNTSSLKFEHNQHTNSLKNVDHNDKNLFLSCDTNEVIVVDVQTNKIVRKVFNDQFKPEKSYFQSAYFSDYGKNDLIFCHYLIRNQAYVTKQYKGIFQTAQITKDQSCLTAYNKNLKILGIACGNGSTYMVKESNLSVIGKQHNHGYVITGGTISRGGRFVTGTPQCSYNIQQSDEPLFPCSYLPFASILIALLIMFLLGSPVVYSDISQGQF